VLGRAVDDQSISSRTTLVVDSGGVSAQRCLMNLYYATKKIVRFGHGLAASGRNRTGDTPVSKPAPPILMNNSKEASPRLLIAEFGERRANARFIWCRGVVTVGCVLLYVSAGLYLKKGHVLLSEAEAFSLFVGYLIYTAYSGRR